MLGCLHVCLSRMELFLSGSTPLDDLCVGHPFSLDRVFSVFMLFLENAKGENTEKYISASSGKGSILEYWKSLILRVANKTCFVSSY